MKCLLHEKYMHTSYTKGISFKSYSRYDDSIYKTKSTLIPQCLNVLSDALQGTDNNITRGLTLWSLKHLFFLF